MSLKPMFKKTKQKKNMSPQVILISSSANPVPDVFAEKLSQRTGCKVIHLKGEKQVELERLLKEKKLGWKEVAYIGERAKYVSQWKRTSRNSKFSGFSGLN